MSYLRKIEWEITPKDKPQIRRNCPKCGEKAYFINTEKFRVNANKSYIDVWLIYQCAKCKSTLNLTIYERVNPKSIENYEYERFLSNDKELALSYGFDIGIHNMNKAELVFDFINYNVTSKELSGYSERKNEQEIKLSSKYPLQLRVDKLLSEQLNISRSQVKNLYEKGLIHSSQEKKLSKAKVEDGMVISIPDFYYASFQGRR